MLYYVMPFVEGESLRNRLDREKQLPVGEAIRITVAVAGALDYAHRHNVVHRDLKTENILLQDGQPVVSDFGIALAVTNAGGTRVTQTGLSLGTPQYMSPEQATGDRVIDARSDIYSLGAVLYEMLTGEPPHTGATVQAIIARVLTDKARSVRATRDMVPENVDAAIQRALAKLPADRFATAKEFGDALQDPRYTLPAQTSTVPATTGTQARARSVSARYAPWALAAATCAVALVSLTRRTPTAELPLPARFELTLPDSLVFRGTAGDMAISPDGSQIAMVVRHGTSHKLAVRALNETNVRLIDGAIEPYRPFFSPDGEMVGFTSAGVLRVVSRNGGAPRTILSQTIPGLISWGDSGLVYAMQGRLMRLSPSGGKPVPLATPDSGVRHNFPSAAPNGSTLMTVSRGGDAFRLAVVDPGGRVRILGPIGVMPRWVESGHVLYSTPEGNLMALPVDRNLTPTADPILVQDGVRIFASSWALWSAATNGTIVLGAGRTPQSKLVIVDRNGRFTPLSDHERGFRLPRVSPDGNRIAIQVGTFGTNVDSDIWLLDRRTGALSRFTTTAGNSDPIWTPDGKHIVFAGREASDSSAETGRYSSDVYWQDVEGTTPELLYGGPGSQYPWSITPDGKTLVMDVSAQPSKIASMTIGSPESMRDLVRTTFLNRIPKVSPDGKWLAHTSNETGRTEVYVRPFPGPGRAEQVSVNGGDQPLWSHDGRELFFRDGVSFVAARMEAGLATSRTVLFEDTFLMSNATNYDVLPDGRFIMLYAPVDRSPLNVLVNWQAELKRRSQPAQR
jgi:serine/threonine-protein kinase